MKRFIQSVDRSQGTLLPEHLDDYVQADNPVRVVDVFVDQLDLCNSQLKQDTFLSNLLIEFLLKFQRGLVAVFECARVPL
jgi:hypothetical protein